MTLFDILAILLTLTATFSYLNHRFIGLPITIGVMLIALSFSLLLQITHRFGIHLEQPAQAWLNSIDFNKTLLHGMLSFLLFAGALHTNLDDLFEKKWTISSLAIVGTLLSTFFLGSLTWWVLGWLGLETPFLLCLLFGALISPTDPIAVLSILKHAGAPKSLETKIVGESLFNDGISVVVFLAILEIVTGSHELSASHITGLFLQETIGGVLFGLAIGSTAYAMLKSVNQYQVEVLITLALVAGGYALANALHVSGPIAIVVAGLLIGNQGRHFAMSEQTREHLDLFWELIDEILNAVLFVLIGVEVLVLTFTQQYVLAGLILIPLVLLARFIAIGLPFAGLRHFHAFTPGSLWILTWGGLRGGISVALALSLPNGPERDLIVAITYMVVIFSIIVQGLTVEKLVKWIIARSETTH